MSKEKLEHRVMTFDTEAGSTASEVLSDAGSARREFLSRLGKWGGALTVFGLGAESAMQALFQNSVLSSAVAAGLVPQEVPPPPVPTGRIYWVAVNGSDSNSGTELSPFASVKRAHDACSMGDGIYVKAGTYVSGAIDWRKSEVILRGAPGTTRDQVILERSGSGNGYLLGLRSNRANGGDPPIENVQIYGLTLQGGPTLLNPWSAATREAAWRTEVMWVGGHVRNLKVINCVVRHCFNRGVLHASPGSIYSSSDIVHDIEWAYNDFYLIGGDTAGGDISLGSRIGFIHIHHNELHGDVDGVVVEGAYIGSLVENNHIYDHLGPAGDGNGSSEDGVDIKQCWRNNPLLPVGHRTAVRNNVIRGHPKQTGITVQFGTQRVDIYGNDIYENGTGIWLREGYQTSGEGTRDVNINNNDLHDNGRRAISLTDGGCDGVQITNNRLYNNGNAEVFETAQRKCGLSILAGSGISILGNIISNNGGLSTNSPQYDIDSVSRLAQSNNNTFYLPATSFRVARVGNSFYALSEWRSVFSQDQDSTEKSAQYRAPVAPESPGRVEVTGIQNVGGIAQSSADAIRRRPPGSLG